MEYRSPLENIINIFGGLPQGHDKPVKHAVYNALALFLLFLGCCAGWALYLILEPFIKPLVWALLVGSVLHPLKHKLAQRFRSWFNALEENHTPVLVGILFVPINIIDNVSELLGSKLVKYLRIIIAFVIIVPTLHVTYYHTPKGLVNFVYACGFYGSYGVIFVISHATASLISIFVVGYVGAIVFLWSPSNNLKFHCVSVFMWLVFSCFLANQFGSLSIPIFILLIAFSIGGLILEIRDVQQRRNKAEIHSILWLNRLQMRSTYLTPDITDIPISVNISSDEKIAVFKYFKSAERTEGEMDALILNNEESTENASEKQKYSDINLREAAVQETTQNLKPCAAKPPEEVPDSLRKDPWELELFQDKSSNDLKEKRTGILITDKGNIHVIKQPTRDVFDPPKMKRSLSQPYCSDTRMSKPRYGVLKWKRTNSFLNISVLDESSSDFYLYSVLWACIAILFWKNIMLLPILPIPILIYMMKHVGIYLGLWKWLLSYWNRITDVTGVWCDERYDALVPIHIRGLWKITYNVNSYLKETIKECIDTVSSCVVIFGLIIFVLCASVFIAIQVYAEGIMLVQMTSNVINQTVVYNPELRQLLPPTFDDTVDSLLDNAYQYGREGISKVVKSIMTDVDPTKSEKFEKQVLELWDRVYQTWMASDDGSHGPQVTTEAVQHSWNTFVKDIQKSPELFNINGVIAFLKQNIGTLLSLLESVWGIVKGNVGLLVGSFSAFMSVLLGGGTAFLNFVLNTIIFLTTLFYLLTSSGYLYKPVEIMSNFSSSSSRFGIAFGAAINGVFKASVKMGLFYGMWTWFIHNLFGVKIVYIPTVLAAVLAAAPFLGTYWACFPAILDLWLAQDKPLCAVLIAIFQFLPTSVVDTTIYGEIKGGGHPYLTGLAIAGGIFCLGLEGAIIGPLILCGLYVAIDLSSSLFKDSPSEESINLQHLSRLELQDI